MLMYIIPEFLHVTLKHLYYNLNFEHCMGYDWFFFFCFAIGKLCISHKKQHSACHKHFLKCHFVSNKHLLLSDRQQSREKKHENMG